MTSGKTKLYRIKLDVKEMVNAMSDTLCPPSQEM
jgi:hypothetical protein